MISNFDGMYSQSPGLKFSIFDSVAVLESRRVLDLSKVDGNRAVKSRSVSIPFRRSLPLITFSMCNT
jgi:hypothetical protein